MSVVSKTTETNAVRPYFVSRFAGPRVAGQRVEKGQELKLTEHQARALLLSGELVAEKARVDDPWGEQERAAEAAAEKAAAEKAAADKADHDAQAAEAAHGAEQAAADKAAAAAAAAQSGADHHDDAHAG